MNQSESEIIQEPEIQVKTIKRQTLNQRVYENIKASILGGDLPAGAKLFEVQMAKHLGVSATPVREAFRMLAMEGLVRIDPWKGAVVQHYSEQETLDVTQCRAALETLALRLTFGKMKPGDLKAIEYMISQYASTTNTSDFVQISSAIHNIWIDGCGNQKLAILMGQLNQVLLYERNITANDEARKEQIIKEHINILQALKDGDVECAVDALNTHIFNGYRYTKKAIL